jgi:hypothetical protein
MASEHRSEQSSSAFIEPLPSRPNLEMQHKRAKELARAAWSGDPDALTRVSALHPKPPAPDVLTLADAQLVVARGYGFDSWPALKRKIESLTVTPVERFLGAIDAGDADEVRHLLQTYAEVRAAINAPIGAFDGRPVAAAKKNLPVLDVLLEFGADLNLKSEWWAGGFGILDYDVTPEEAAPLIERGATVDVFAAAHLGMFDRLRALVDADPALVHARGGDGKTALHSARTVEIARYLLDRGADIDARDVDHESTAAQYLVRDVPDVARLLVDRGAWFDIYLAIGLRDRALVERCLRDDPHALDHRTGQGLYAVAHNGRTPATREAIGNRRGDTYRWVFDHHISPVGAAVLLGFDDMVALLLAHASPVQRLLAACATADRLGAERIVAEHPGLVAGLTPEQQRLIAERAYAGDTAGVALMMDLGFDVRATGPDRADALHWAGFLGNVDMLHVLLRRDPAIGVRDGSYGGTPLQGCIHGAVHGWRRAEGDFPDAARLLLAAGERIEAADLPTGRDDLDAVLRDHLMGRPGRP